VGDYDLVKESLATLGLAIDVPRIGSSLDIMFAAAN